MMQRQEQGVPMFTFQVWMPPDQGSPAGILLDWHVIVFANSRLTRPARDLAAHIHTPSVLILTEEEGL